MADLSSDLNLALRIRALVEGQDAVVGLGTSFIDLNQRIENLIRGLTAISGSTEGAQREFEYLAGVAQKYGLKILDLSDNYVKLIASSKGTALEGEAVKKVFESVSGAMSVLGGETITTHRAFTALAQMMSKGQIYSEELKGQLAEAIPGALGIMSRALGITTDDLRNLMEAGSLSAEVLLPFATQLSKEYGNLATSGRTFTQSVNDLKNTWTLLMERLSSGSGAFGAISASIEYLSKSSGVLAGIIGIGMASAFVKLTASISSTVSSVKNFIPLIGVQATATQRAAAANLEAAIATEATAAANARSALSSERLLNAQLAIATNAHVRQRIEAALQVAVAQRIISDKQAAAAALQLASAQGAVVSSVGFLSRALNFLAGPGGLILTSIAAFGAMAFAFREQDTATKNLSKSTEEYARSLETMTTEETAAAIKKAEIDRKTSSDRIAQLKSLIEYQQRQIDSSTAGSEQYNSYVSGQIKLVSELEKEESKLVDTDIKLGDSRSSLAGKSAKLILDQQKLSLSSDELNISMKAQRAEIAALQKQKQDGESVDRALQEAQTKLAKTGTELVAVTAKLKENQKQQTIAMSDYVKSQQALAPAISGTSATLKDQGLTTEQLEAKFRALVQAQVLSVDRQNILKRSIIELKGEQEALGISLKAQVDLLNRQSAALGDVVAARESNIAKAEAERHGAQQSLIVSRLELQALEEERREKAILLETNPKLAKQTGEQIAKLDGLIAKQKAEVEARQSNAIATRDEAEAAKVAGEILSASQRRQVEEAKALQDQLAQLRDQYAEMVASGERMEIIAAVLEAIRLKEKEIADQANNTAIATSAAFRSLGLNAEEVLTGMDFETRKAIDALRTLGSQGKLTGDDLRKAMDKAIDLADTREEIGALKSALYELAKSGKISTEEYKQSIVALNVKLAEMRAELDPTQRALAALGLGVPERMNAISKSMKANSEIVRDGTKSLALGQDAFLKYAEAEIEAAQAGDRAVDAQVNGKAAALGLSNAYEELVRNLARANPEFDAITAKMGRIAEMSELQHENTKADIDLNIEHIETLQQKDKILGDGINLAKDLIEESKLTVALAKEEYQSKKDAVALDEEKIAALEKERVTRGKLAPEQERELAIMKAKLPISEDELQKSKEKVVQLEHEAFAQSRVVEQINRVVEASIIEESAASAVLRSRLETIESEIDLAKAKGDTAKAIELQAEKSRVEKDILDLGIQAREDATAAARAYVESLVALAEQDGTVTEIERHGIDTARQRIEILEQEEEAYRKNAEAIKEKSQAEIASIDASDRAREAAEQTRVAGQLASDTLNGWIAKLNDLSPAAVEAFEKMRNFTDSTVATASSSDKAKRSIDDLGAAMVSLGDTGFVRFMNEAAVQALTVEASFYAQAQSADSLAQSLNDMADSGTGNMEAMIRSAESARATMDLLDQTRLDSLQSAIDRARGSMDSLRESSEAALDAARRALLQQQGDQRAILELDRKQKIAELDKQIAAAQAANDIESLSNLQKALDLEERTYNLKVKALDADREKNKRTREEPPASSTGTAPASGPTTINNTFLIDPTKLANEEWVKKNVMPTIEKVGRLRA